MRLARYSEGWIKIGVGMYLPPLKIEGEPERFDGPSMTISERFDFKAWAERRRKRNARRRELYRLHKASA